MGVRACVRADEHCDDTIKNSGQSQNTGKHRVFSRIPMFFENPDFTENRWKQLRNGAKVENHVFRKIAGEAKTQVNTGHV